MESRGLRQFAWILVWKQINGWSKNGASRGVVCGCTGVFRAGQPREHGSEGCPRSHMDHPHFEAIGGQMGFHHCQASTLLESGSSNRLYAFMARLIPKLDTNNVVWTVENPWTSLLWKTSYWRRIAKLKPWYCELHNCMFGGSRLKRTCIASSCGAVMALAIKCDGQHTHAPWLVKENVFDTSLEAEYTPALAKALAQCVLEYIAGEFKLPNIQQFSKRLKLSHFSAIAAAKQPTKPVAMALVPEFFTLGCFVEHSHTL